LIDWGSTTFSAKTDYFVPQISMLYLKKVKLNKPKQLK